MTRLLRPLLLCTLFCLLISLAPSSWAGEAPKDTVDAQAAFERLKALEGTWHATPEGENLPEEEAAQPMDEVGHEFRVSAAGSVVMETMAAGTDHEMINMYHVDGDDLMVTHYCAGNNQPRMRLNREKSTGKELVFDFVDATNLEDGQPHIHAIRIDLLEDGRVDSAWTGYQGGEPAGVMTFHLARGD